MLHATFDICNNSRAGVQDISGLAWSFSMEPLPPSLYQHNAKANAFGLANRTGTRVVCLLTQSWSNADDDERVYAATTALIAAIEDAARSLDVYDPFLYLNYAAPWQNPIASYGNASVQQLRALRARVDPKGIFTDQVPGAFKIS